MLGACIPAGFPMPSQKVRVFTRGFFSTGTTGDGYIQWRPTLAGDLGNAVVFTTAASVGTAATDFNAFTALGSLGIPKIPYTVAQFTNNEVEGRMVSGCIRVRYSGTEDARAGVISLFEDPDHIAITSMSAQDISDYDSCGKERPSGDGDWAQINWSGPAKQAEQEYVNSSGGVVGAFAPACIVIAVNGTMTGAGALGPATYEFECWENLEFLGRSVVGKTNNVLDPDGMLRVVSAMQTVQSQDKPLSPKNPNVGPALASVFAPKTGGTTMGNAVQAGMNAVNPGIGALWGIARSGFNSMFRRRK